MSTENVTHTPTRTVLIGDAFGIISTGTHFPRHVVSDVCESMSYGLQGIKAMTSRVNAPLRHNGIRLLVKRETVEYSERWERVLLESYLLQLAVYLSTCCRMLNCSMYDVRMFSESPLCAVATFRNNFTENVVAFVVVNAEEAGRSIEAQRDAYYKCEYGRMEADLARGMAEAGARDSGGEGSDNSDDEFDKDKYDLDCENLEIDLEALPLARIAVVADDKSAGFHSLQEWCKDFSYGELQNFTADLSHVLVLPDGVLPSDITGEQAAASGQALDDLVDEIRRTLNLNDMPSEDNGFCSRETFATAPDARAETGVEAQD